MYRRLIISISISTCYKLGLGVHEIHKRGGQTWWRSSGDISTLPSVFSFVLVTFFFSFLLFFLLCTLVCLKHELSFSFVFHSPF